MFLGAGACVSSASSYCFYSFACALGEGGGRVSARRPTHFSLPRQRKVSKRKATLQSATPAGQTCVGAFAGCAVELATRWRAALGQPRRVRLRGMRAKAPMLTPQTPRRRRSQKGVNRPTATRAVAALGPDGRRRFAPRSARPSVATARRDVRLRVPFRMRRGAQVLGDQGSRLFECREAARV